MIMQAGTTPETAASNEANSLLDETSTKFEAALRERLKLSRKKGHLALNVVTKHQALIREACSRNVTLKEIHQSLLEAGVTVSYTRFTVVWRNLNGRMAKGESLAAAVAEAMPTAKSSSGKGQRSSSAVMGGKSQSWRADPVRESLEK